MKILIYSPTCQSLSSSNKPLIKYIIVVFVKNTKNNNIEKPNPSRKSYYYFIFALKIKFHFLYTKNK